MVKGLAIHGSGYASNGGGGAPRASSGHQLAVSALTSGVATLSVTTALGQAMLTRQVTLAAGATGVALPEAAQWPRSMYVLHLA